MGPQGEPHYAERECGWCWGGAVHIGGPEEVRTAPCPDCGGTGRVLAYLYPKPKGRRGPWPPGCAAEGETTEKEDLRG